MFGSWLGRILLGAAEHLLAVAMVLFFFGVFMGTLAFSFPEGKRLADLVLRDEPARSRPSRPAPELDLGRYAVVTRPVVAELSHVRRRVKERRADAIAWSEATPGIDLFHRHAVQTFAASGATIRFTPGNELRLDENSLIILKSFVEIEGTSHRRASLIVLDGELRGRIVPEGDEVVDLEVVAPDSEARIRTRADAGDQAEFAIRTSPAEGSTVSLYAGTAEVRTSRATIELDANESVTVTPDGAPGEPAPLPRSPRPRSPADGSVHYHHDAPPRIPFRWRGDDRAEAYRLVIARDPGFEETVFEDTVRGTEFVHGNLKPGDYYWKVSGVTGMAEGPPGPVGHLEVLEDEQPPPLSVEFPESPVRGNEAVIRGSTDPGTEVFIDDRRVEIGESGSFEFRLKLRPGVNVVVVEAIDGAGNTTYRSELVDARF